MKFLSIPPRQKEEAAQMAALIKKAQDDIAACFAVRLPGAIQHMATQDIHCAVQEELVIAA